MHSKHNELFFKKKTKKKLWSGSIFKVFCLSEHTRRRGGDLALNVRRMPRGGLDSEEDMDVTSETSETTPE